MTIGVFELERDRYRPTELGDQLGDDGTKLQLDTSSAGGRAELAFVELLHTITTGEPASRTGTAATSGRA